ncbi:MAG TPA: dihydroneopterin aldolase [Candidatus Krumholzibacteria bacterium]|nr:dihydroneopterin aldolase [Candidatus Krumholzibacteria bacterium]HPD70537.1 dihydroneopterin aldolase [Candidatus Krumholzibacteria bacterium]HRY39763.1 dihydroneopterin aldolase [Candidatus Krumholzibacteria bacterium]
MSDRIEIKNLLVRGILGVKAEEREKRQDILVNLELAADLRPAAVSDDLERSVNYRSVTKDVIALVEGSAFHTIETLATEIARAVLVGYPVEAVTVRVEKPGAPRFAESVGVVIARTRADFA